MGKTRKVLGDSFTWVVRNLNVIAIVFIVASVVASFRASLSPDTHNFTFWGWLSWSLACSLFLNRYSISAKSMKVYLLSLFDIIFVISVSVFSLFGVQALPELSGFSLCLSMLIFTAIHCCIIFPEYRKCRLTGACKNSVIIPLGAAVTGAVLAFFVPQWVMILMLDAATAISIILFRKNRKN